jgi:hypothetical protein
MRKYNKASSLLAVILLVSTTILFAQNGVIVIGTIVRPNNIPAVNVYVSIAGVGRYTDIQGRYRLDGIPLGHQQMRVEDPRQPSHILLEKPMDVSGPMARIDQTLPQ